MPYINKWYSTTYSAKKSIYFEIFNVLWKMVIYNTVKMLRIYDFVCEKLQNRFY